MISKPEISNVRPWEYIIPRHRGKFVETIYGSLKLWDELSGQYPSFGFQHGNGLGVIAVGKFNAGGKGIFENCK